MMEEIVRTVSKIPLERWEPSGDTASKGQFEFSLRLGNMLVTISESDGEYWLSRDFVVLNQVTGEKAEYRFPSTWFFCSDVLPWSMMCILWRLKKRERARRKKLQLEKDASFALKFRNEIR